MFSFPQYKLLTLPVLFTQIPRQVHTRQDPNGVSCNAWYSHFKFIIIQIFHLSKTYKNTSQVRKWGRLHAVITSMTCKFSLFDRGRLENYEQSCAVDSVTKQCAGLPGDCRMAMLGILGTDLRSNCACKGTDFTQLYDCMGWQRILWFNPCVGKYTSRLSYSLLFIWIFLSNIGSPNWYKIINRR